MLPARSEIDDACDWDALVRESDGELPNDVSDVVLLAQYREAKRRARKRWHVWRFVIALIAAAIIIALLAAGAMPARAHEFWINKYKSPSTSEQVAGTSCCGKNDCFVFPADQVKAGKTGWLIIPLQEIVPYSETQGSEDGAFWRCKRYDGSRRCFFAPQPSS